MYLTSAMIGLLSGLLLRAYPALAGVIRDAANMTNAGQLPTFSTATCTGATCLFALVTQARSDVLFVVVPLGLVLITYAALRVVTNSNEEELTKAKKTVGAVLSAIVLALLVQPIYEAVFGPNKTDFFGVPGAWDAGDPGASILCEEFTAFFNWVEILVAVVAVTIIISAGARAVYTFGATEESSSKLKKTVLGVVLGILVLVNKAVISQSFGIDDSDCTLLPTVSASPVLDATVDIINKIVIFLALILIVIIVYAGFQMLLSFGRDEQISKAKNLIIRALIGFFVIAVSLLLISFVIGLL
jgi:hypothetical protein